WTRKNPPNYVERSHVLLGRTVDAGRVWDVIAAARYLGESSRYARGPSKGIRVAGSGSASLIAAYAAILDERVSGVTLVSPPTTHNLNNEAPQFLNVLRVCDVPDALGLLAPRSLTILSSAAGDFSRTAAAYASAGAKQALNFKADGSR